METEETDPIEWLAQMAVDAEKRIIEQPDQETTPQNLFLPGFEEIMRAMPNHIARSSLFAPVARGKKKIHKGVILESRSDAVIKFSGEQLDEAQADVWMQCMKEAMQKPLGKPVIINRAGFLKEIGRPVGNTQYQWLQRSMEALAFAMLTIEVSKAGKPKYHIGKNRAIHLIAGFDYDETLEEYTLTIDPRWKTMFDNREFALVDWEKRLQFGKQQDYAKALQRLIATSSDEIQKYGLEWLKGKLVSEGSELRKFKASLLKAANELLRLKIITKGEIIYNTRKKEEELVLYVPAKSPSKWKANHTG